MQSQLDTVKSIYANFGKGDVPAILEVLSEDMDWIFYGPKEIPFAGQYRGKREVGQFFQRVGESARVEAYEPREFLEGEGHVTVLGWQKVKAVPTGKTWETHFCHVWSLKNGKCVRVREIYDTAPMVDAFVGK